MSRRTDRVNVTMQRELGRLIDEELSDPRLNAMTSVTRVECTADLGLARVYVSVLGLPEERDQSLEALRSASGFLRRELDDRIHIRHVPRLEFLPDPALAEGAEMLKVMDEVARQDSLRPQPEPRDEAPGVNGEGT